MIPVEVALSACRDDTVVLASMCWQEFKDLSVQEQRYHGSIYD